MSPLTRKKTNGSRWCTGASCASKCALNGRIQHNAVCRPVSPLATGKTPCGCRDQCNIRIYPNRLATDTPPLHCAVHTHSLSRNLRFPPRFAVSLGCRKQSTDKVYATSLHQRLTSICWPRCEHRKATTSSPAGLPCLQPRTHGRAAHCPASAPTHGSRATSPDRCRASTNTVDTVMPAATEVPGPPVQCLFPALHSLL